MSQTKLINAVSTRSDGLVTEVLKLFREAVNVRNMGGITNNIRLGHIRDILEQGEDHPFFEATQEKCGGKSEGDCSTDDDELTDACSIEDTLKSYQERSPLSSLASLLTTVKKYEFISLVENAYAQIGNKPFKLKAGKQPTLTDKQIEEAGKEFYDFLENFLETNEVRTDEIAQAFNLETLGEVTTVLADVAQQDAELRISESITANESVIERVFQRSDFMSKYIEVIKDTADYPIGVMWIDDKSLKKERYIKGGKLALKYTIQADAHRVDPSYFWATEDHKLNDVGRAVFRLTQFTHGDLVRWTGEGETSSVTGSKMITDNLNDYLDSNKDGYRMHEAMLFNNHMTSYAGIYDVVISRGTFDKKQVIDLGVAVPDIYKNESFIPCEIYFSGNHILRVRVMECIDDRLGVYTTVFRRKGQSIFGWSLHDFIYPFAKMYQGAMDAVDRSVGKSVSSIIQIDTGVIEDSTKLLKLNEATGEAELDLSDDVIVEFDSSNGFTSPNFKGVPITIDQLPSDLNKLLPAIDLIHKELERISGIPSILVNGSNVSSALRTTSNFNAAFSASAKVIQSLLRESETRILKPGIQFIFDAKAMSGDLGEFLLETDPEILLSDTLNRELNDDNNLSQSLGELAQFASYIPPENMSKLINAWGREVHNLTEDLIPGTGTLSTATPSTPTQQV